MSVLLLLVIYVAFIGLGVPDSLFGVAWPAIYKDFELPFSFGSFVTAIVYCGTVVSSLFSASLIKKFGTYKITVFSTALTAIALLAFSFSGNLICFCLCAVPLGLGAGCIDTALNNYVALHYSSMQMNFLHCFYGIGITLSPYILSLMLQDENGWRNGYRIAFFIQFFIAFVVFVSLPVWKKVACANKEENSEEQIQVMGVKEIVRMPGVKPIWFILFGLSAVESICNAWGATYLVEDKSFVPEAAAGIVMFYFVGMACGRFLAGVIASKLHNVKIILLGQVILGVALVILMFSGNQYWAAIGFFLIGFGNGPLFPNVTCLIPSLFGASVTPSIIGTLMAIGSVSLMIFPVLCGFLGQLFGMWVFTVIMLVFYAMMVVATVRIVRKYSAAFSR